MKTGMFKFFVFFFGLCNGQRKGKRLRVFFQPGLGVEYGFKFDSPGSGKERSGLS